MAKTKIEWAEKVWNPISGCSKVSEGCRNCYAEGIAKRFWKDRKFTDVRVHPERLRDPMHWRKPQHIFVNSMSDLFHERIYDNDQSFIDEVFAVAAACPQHTFMILTKRSGIMRNYFNHPRRSMYVESALEWLFEGRIHMMPELVWPLPNVWLGVSVEDQRAAEQRIPDLLATPAKVRFLSCEPLLGRVELDEIPQAMFSVEKDKDNNILVNKSLLDWVIVGGESGPKARPMHPDWVRGIRDQCLAGNVPFFFKQWGEFLPSKPKYVNEYKYYLWGDGTQSDKVGKKKAGRVLDEKEWNEFPMSK